MFFKKSPKKLEDKCDEEAEAMKNTIRDYKSYLKDPDAFKRNMIEEYEKEIHEAKTPTQASMAQGFGELIMQNRIANIQTLGGDLKQFISKYTQAKELYTSDVDKKRVEEKIEFYKKIQRSLVHDLSAYQARN
jgi:hypothetical protein